MEPPTETELGRANQGELRMKLLVTGASGFLGEYVVAEALRCGHQVRAMVRPSPNLEQKLAKLARIGHDLSRWDSTQVPSRQGEINQDKASQDGFHLDPTSRVEIAVVDLASGDGLDAALQDIDAVIHLAALKTGDYSTQFANTVTATDCLLNAIERAGCSRLVAISSFSVYDYLHQPEGALLDESAPLERRANTRDAYAQTKLKQEELVHDFQARSSTAVTVLRPGIIYGAEALWPAHLGIKLTDTLFLQIGTDARLPLTYVENCAEAVVKALDSDGAIGQVINVTDNDCPTQQEFLDCLRRLRKQFMTIQHSLPTTFTVSWKTMRYIARGIWTINCLLGQRLPLPGVFVPARLHARFKPLDYSNYSAQSLLHWSPRYTMPEAITRSLLDCDRHPFSDKRLSRAPSISSRPTPRPVSITAS